MLNPTRTFRHEARFWMLRVVARILCAPFFYVNFADFWVADQLNSLAVAFADFHYMACFYWTKLFSTEGDWEEAFSGGGGGEDVAQCGAGYNWVRAIVYALPAWFRYIFLMFNCCSQCCCACCCCCSHVSLLLLTNMVVFSSAAAAATTAAGCIGAVAGAATTISTVVAAAAIVSFIVPLMLLLLPHLLLYPILSLVDSRPLRFAQCLRRYRDSGEAFPHLVNAGKYSTTFFVVVLASLRSWSEKEEEGAADAASQDMDPGIGSPPSPDDSFPSLSPFFYPWAIAAVVSTCYAYAWDILMDWGLFDENAGENRL